MDSEDGQVFVKNLAYFIHTHEKALANALQLQRQRSKHASQHATTGTSSTPSSSTSSFNLADAFSRPYLALTSQAPKPAKLTLTPHHLYYLLSKFEDLGVDVGAMNVRLETLHSDTMPSNYVSFLGHAPKSRGRQSDAESLRSVSSVRSVMSSMSSMWSSFSLGNSAAKAEKQMAQHREDIRYLYSCFTKIPALRLAPDHRARLIAGYEEFPFDTAVPLFAFKNVSALEISDLDFRQFYGWDRLSEQLRSLTLRRGHLDDPIDLLLNIVLDDMDKRRKRSSRAPVPTTPSTPGVPWPASSPRGNIYSELARSYSAPNSPLADQRKGHPSDSPQSAGVSRGGSSDGKTPIPKHRERSDSPVRPTSSRHGSLQKQQRSKARRGSASSGSSTHEPNPRHSTTDLLMGYALPPSKWRFLRHLSLAENSLTFLTAASFAPVAGTLTSLDLSGNLFTEIPDALASLTHLRALNLSNCMIEGLQSLARNPLPAIASLNLRSNRLLSLAGIERLYSLEKIDVRDNRLHDPTELARLTGIPELTDVYVSKNPFTRTHGNFRVTIFNLFRSTPGHHEDIIIDGVGPAYSEKKQLVDRVPEPINVPVVKPIVEDDSPPPPPPPPKRPETPASPEELAPLPRVTMPSRAHRRTNSDVGPRTSQPPRRKRAPRRRIVELSQAEAAKPVSEADIGPAPVPQLTDLPPPRTESESEEPITPEATPYSVTPIPQTTALPSPQRPTLDTAFTSPTPAPRIRDASDDDDENTSPLELPQDVGGNTDLYRQKIEALKHDLGPNWLAALSEPNFEGPRSRNRSFSPASRSSTVRPERSARGVSVGGRTLG